MGRQNLVLIGGAAVGLVYFFAIRFGMGIKCYECTSYTDPRCADPFDNRSFPQTDCTLKRMPHLGDMEPTICRKTRQKVDGEWRFIRSCAYLGEPGLDGDERYCRIMQGTFNIHVEHCECRGKDGCNSGVNLRPSNSINLIPWVWAGLLLAAGLPSWRRLHFSR